ncbi:MAG TPA: aldo/keto reductase [Verrucomicrobiae bacterium]|nr:aldo/keto reductase [Verrucomicrobiae bacterium]
MQTVLLGKSSLTCSRLAYGCWRITGNPEGGKTSPEAEANGRKAVIAAYECGYTFFDLADIYSEGGSERIFGQALKEVSAMRQRILIATKCGIRRKGDPHPDSPYRYDFSADHIVRSCEESLKRMGVDTIDLYQLHRPDYLGDPQEVAEAFGRLKKSGKVREFGVSNFRPSQVVAFQKVCPMPLIANQVELSLARLDCFRDGTLDQCLAEQITPMAWSPLAAGRLPDTGPIDLQTPDHAHRIHIRETLDLVARERGVTRSVAALAWLLRHPSKIVPVIGTTNPERIRDAINATEIELSRDDWYRLMEAAHGERLP